MVKELIHTIIIKNRIKSPPTLVKVGFNLPQKSDIGILQKYA